MNLKIGGNNVGKIMYNGQEFGGAAKLEPGTILYLGYSGVPSYDDELNLPNSTAEIVFPNVGKHWEGLKKIAIYNTTSKEVFDVNSIDEPTQLRYGHLTIHRERSLTDEADKLIVKTYDSHGHRAVITVEE